MYINAPCARRVKFMNHPLKKEEERRFRGGNYLNALILTAAIGAAINKSLC
jgi:hypothetical protein